MPLTKMALALVLSKKILKIIRTKMIEGEISQGFVNLKFRNFFLIR
jgi:hypothetical protein